MVDNYTPTLKAPEGFFHNSSTKIEETRVTHKNHTPKKSSDTNL